MKIILSPAKKMNVDTDSLKHLGLPSFIDKAIDILACLKDKSKEKLKALWKCNDKIADQNFKRLETMNLYKQLTPAVLAYEGIAYQYMAENSIENPVEIKNFDRLGYSFREDLSSETEYVFERKLK